MWRDELADLLYPGRELVVVNDRSKVIQPLEAGVIKAIRVKDGDRVQAGQVLLDLDPTQAQADHRSVQEQARAIRSESSRARALLAAARSGLAPTPAAGSSAEDRSMVMSEWADIAGRLARMRAPLQSGHVCSTMTLSSHSSMFEFASPRCRYRR